MQKIKYSSGSSSAFFKSLNQVVQDKLINTRELKKAQAMLWVKTVFYFLLHIYAYVFLYSQSNPSDGRLALCYFFVGISGILLGFNVSHDACHDALSKNKFTNTILYHLTFNMQGTSAWLWKIRHNSSHHVFPNVDGCDADIDNNPFLRLSPQHPLKKYQQYQHLYAIAVYCLYTLHWFLVKDILYLFKKRVANIKNNGYPARQIIIFICWKLAYLAALLFIPIWLGFSPTGVLLAFLVMHVANSLIFIHVLIATHLCMETEFPITDNIGALPFDYYTHQLATSLDYAPLSKICNLFLGGFNAHAAHHLYPRLPHTLYPQISKLIQEKANEFGVPYNQLSLLAAIRSHYKYLKKMGRSDHSTALSSFL
ncbi:MAG: acyl-CoA desaturase [Chitinophagaceae bacterium]|nr:acyl-CoA desaturase [Chitinophagaceae bacterium]